MQTAISILDLLHFDAPTIEQKAALLAMAEFVKEDNNDDFLVLCGAAGTGKSSIMTALIGYLNQKDLTYHMAAPTGRAARILTRKTNTLANTVHSLIYRVVSDPKTGIVRFVLRTTEDDSRTVFIIDEASMVNAMPAKEDGALFVAPNALLTDLARYIKSGNPFNKVIFLGDRNQLPPVGEQDSYALQPSYLREKFGWTGTSHILTEVKRQQDGSQILKDATAIREAIDSGGTPTVTAPRVGTIYKAASLYTMDLMQRGPNETVSIGRTHKANRFFSDLVRERLFGGKNLPLQVGDLLLVTQTWNRNECTLYNGDHVRVAEIHPDKIEQVAGLHFMIAKLRYQTMDGTEGLIEDYILLDTIYSERGAITSTQENMLRGERYRKNVRFRESGNPEDDRYVGAIRLMYGYAITCHKAQGGEWDKVYVNTFGKQDLKWSYTAITRAKSTLLCY